MKTLSRELCIAIVICLLSLLSLMGASGQGLVNGSFEVPAISNSIEGYSVAPAGFGWTIATGNIDVNTSEYWQSSRGNQTIDMNGETAGTICQDFTFCCAGTWRIEFDLSANPDLVARGDGLGSGFKTLRVDFGIPGLVTNLGSYSLDSDPRTVTDMRWVTFQTPEIVVSTHVVYRLQFTSLSQGIGGPVLDNVVLRRQNLLANGDFEAGNSGFTSDYTFARTDTAQGTYEVVSNPRDSHAGGASFVDHTSGNGLMLVVNGAADTNRVVWRQTVQVMTNTAYEFSGWAASWGDDGSGHDPNPARARVTINGQDVGPTFQLLAQDGLWQAFAVRWSSKAAESALIELRLETAEGFGNDAAFDDFQFTVFQPRATIRVATVEICWPSVARAIYQVEYESELTGHRWTPLGAAIEGTGTFNCVVDTVTTPPRFYRVRELP